MNKFHRMDCKVQGTSLLRSKLGAWVMPVMPVKSLLAGTVVLVASRASQFQGQVFRSEQRTLAWSQGGVVARLIANTKRFQSETWLRKISKFHDSFTSYMWKYKYTRG